MSRKATKAADNIFYKARMEAASYNDKLSSREGASEVTGVDRNRVAYTELGTINPYPEEVLIYSDAYNAPELLNYYCSNLCPIGKETVDYIRSGSLEQASLQLLASTKHISNIREELIEIARDGVIDNCEKEKMQLILEKLRQASNDIHALEIAYTKIIVGEDNEAKR